MRKALSAAFPEPANLWPTAAPPARDERRADKARSDLIRQGPFIDHRVAHEISAKLSEFVDRPWQEYQRWRGMLFVGDPNNGRTSLVSRVAARGSFERLVLLRLALPVRDGQFWTAIAEAVGRGGYRGSVPDRREEALRALDRRRAIVFDGMDQLADAGARLWPLLAKLKGLGEDARIPVILVVTPRAEAKIRANADWGDRFEVVRLPRWHVDRDYLDLLAAWEEQLPLQQVSYLADRDLALHLYSLCDGKIGALATVLRQAALAAIESGTERITVAQLDNLGFAPPSSFAGFRF